MTRLNYIAIYFHATLASKVIFCKMLSVENIQKCSLPALVKYSEFKSINYIVIRAEIHLVCN